jgi:hypothetical protein
MPTAMDYQKFATMTSGREVIHGAIWDTLLYTSGTTLNLNFFQQTIAATSFDVTNLLSPGQLAYPTQFLVRAIRMWLRQRPESIDAVAAGNIQTGALNNVHLLVNTGLLIIRHGDKEYGRYPLRDITAGNGIAGNIGVSNILVGGAVVDYGQNGIPHVDNILTLAQPLLIETNMNFSYQMQWPAALTLTRNTSICLLLEGDLIRQVQ